MCKFSQGIEGSSGLSHHIGRCIIYIADVLGHLGSLTLVSFLQIRQDCVLILGRLSQWILSL